MIFMKQFLMPFTWERKKFKTVDSVRTFFKEHGVSEKDFNKTFKSFAVRNQIVRTKKLARLYGVNGVPALIVNGKYRTDAKMAGGNAGITRVLNRLISYERKLQTQ